MSFAGQAACKARLFFPPFLLATQKKWGRLSGRDPTPSLKASTPLQQGAGWPPSPPSPSRGRRRMPPHPHPLPQAGEGVQGAALVLPRTPAARLACFDIKIQISGGCLNGATQERSEFRRTSRLQGSPFLSPISFGDAKEMGSAVGPRPDSLPESKHTASTRSRLAPIPAFPQWGKEKSKQSFKEKNFSNSRATNTELTGATGQIRLKHTASRKTLFTPPSHNTWTPSPKPCSAPA